MRMHDLAIVQLQLQNFCTEIKIKLLLSAHNIDCDNYLI